jgi:hypothetical protein
MTTTKLQPTNEQLIRDAAWKRVYRAMSYLVTSYGHAEDAAIFMLGDSIRQIRGEACAS